jgi:hypothetical protein
LLSTFLVVFHQLALTSIYEVFEGTRFHSGEFFTIAKLEEKDIRADAIVVDHVDQYIANHL